MIHNVVGLLRKGGRALIYVWAKEQQRGEDKSVYLRQKRGAQEDVESTGDKKMMPQDTVIDLPVHTNRTDFKHADVFVPWNCLPKPRSGEPVSSDVYLRYYHVFTEGELEGLCTTEADINISRSYYDQGNWCVEFEKV